jgi:hypothetical protein
MQKKLTNMLALAAVGSTCWLGIAASDKQEPKVKWLESPMTVKYEAILSKGETVPSIHIKDSLWESYQKVDTDIQIGLREDGVVVWRKR